MDWLSLLPTAVSGALGVIGVFGGAYMTRKTAMEQQRRTEIRNAYAAVLTSYSQWAMNSGENLASLLAAIAAARLLNASNSEMDKILNSLENAVISDDLSLTHCGNCFNDFRQHAQKEISDSYAKPHFTDMKNNFSDKSAKLFRRVRRFTHSLFIKTKH